MGDIINVLKSVASSEFYLLQKKRRNFDEFQEYLKVFFQLIFLGDFQHPFLEIKPGANFIILITSDAGFLGKLNMSVINSAIEFAREEDIFIVVGKQGAEYFEEIGKKCSFFPGISDDISYEGVEKLRDYIISEYSTRKATRAVIVYPHFVSFAVSDIRQFQLLPCRFLFQEEAGNQSFDKVLIEPSVKRVVESLVRIWLGQMIYGIFWESKLSEWSSRVVHLERSSSEIKDFGKKLSFQYFRIIHEISDKNIREIFASKLAVTKAS